MIVKKYAVVLMMMMVLAGASIAMQPEIVGGIRDGLAVGFMADAPLSRNVGLRFGVEGSTGKQPLIVFFGGKFQLAYVGSSLMSLGLGAVGYSGDSKTDVGIAISVVFNRAFNVKPLFFEFGIDVADRGRLQAQVGYKVF